MVRPYLSCIYILFFHGFGVFFFSPPNSHHGVTDRSWISAGRSSGPTSCSNNPTLSRGCIPESGCLAGGHRRLPTSLQTVSRRRTRFLHPLETIAGWDKAMLMASPTSDAGVWRGGWKRNKAESHSVSSQSSEKEEDSSHMKEQGGAQTPKAGVRKDIPAPRNPTSSGAQTSFHVALPIQSSPLPHLRAALCTMPVGGRHVYPRTSHKGIDFSGGKLHTVRTEYVSTQKSAVEGKMTVG